MTPKSNLPAVQGENDANDAHLRDRITGGKPRPVRKRTRFANRKWQGLRRRLKILFGAATGAAICAGVGVLAALFFTTKQPEKLQALVEAEPEPVRVVRLGAPTELSAPPDLAEGALLGPNTNLAGVERDFAFAGTAVVVETNEPDGPDVALLVRESNAVWATLFRSLPVSYETLLLAAPDEWEDSPCGGRRLQTPFAYCELDSRIYAAATVEMTTRRVFEAAHTVAAHVRMRLGVLLPPGSQIDARRQTDCLAGVWAHHNREGGLALYPEAVEIQLAGLDATPGPWVAQRVRDFGDGYLSGKPLDCANLRDLHDGH
ncbi:MAG: hypothetical protein ACFBSD_10010 [Paracoccaceae bacterium]